MKLLSLLLLAAIICSCKLNPKKEEEATKPKEKLVFTMSEDSISKATAIIWVDRKMKRDNETTVTKILKAKVHIDQKGKITIIDFVKNYPRKEQNYIKHKLINYRIDKLMMDNDYIKPGEQFLQIRIIVNRLDDMAY